MAFLGRYGHQPADVTMGLSASALKALAAGIADIMREEADAMKREGNG